MIASTEEANQLYFKTLGWHAARRSLPAAATEEDILEHDRKQRAKAQRLPEEANWFQISCAELKAGIKNDGDFDYLSGEGFDEWRDDPKAAMAIAREAFEIFAA